MPPLLSLCLGVGGSRRGEVNNKQEEVQDGGANEIELERGGSRGGGCGGGKEEEQTRLRE